MAEALQIPVGARVRKVVRRRSSSAGPVSHITTYLPEERARGISRSDLAQKPLLQLLEESGVEWGRARQTVSARQADAEVAAQLDVVIGTALLSVRRLVYDTQEKPVQLLHGLQSSSVIGIAITSPHIVTIRARPMSRARAPGSPFCVAEILLNEPMIPVTVPSSPTSGAVLATTAIPRWR